jgi:hypothetical protein
MERSDKTVEYRYALLDPRAAAAAQLPRLGRTTLGIEVTLPALAAACGLGNIDPQHGPGGDVRTAIEAALDWPMPPPGTLLVTIRPDLDSIGAMAVLGMRGAGEVFGPEVRARIDQIARADRHDHGAWPGPCPIDSLCTEPAPLAWPALLVADAGLGLFERVAGLRHWLATGQTAPRYREKAIASRSEMAVALRDGSLRLRPPRGDRIALVVSGHPEALRLGYCLAPVVVALNPAFEPPFLAWSRTKSRQALRIVSSRSPGKVFRTASFSDSGRAMPSALPNAARPPYATLSIAIAPRPRLPPKPIGTRPPAISRRVSSNSAMAGGRSCRGSRSSHNASRIGSQAFGRAACGSRTL